jgi:hypothetical protein
MAGRELGESVYGANGDGSEPLRRGHGGIGLEGEHLVWVGVGAD